jgi:hypothetical protein
MFSLKKEILRQDKTKKYMDVTWVALERFPEDYLKQLEYVKENGTKQHYALWLADRVQYLSSLSFGKKLELTSSDTDLIGRSLMDALRYMQQDLPEGVYDYIVNKMENSMLEIMKQLSK